MALTVNTLMEEMRDPFQLQYIAGQDGGEHVVTWVHLMEDPSVAELFLGNELVVTSGYTARDEEHLLSFVDVIHQKPIAGLVINTGKYILSIPPSVIKRCNEYDIPLLTMPWDKSATEFVKACCAKITRNVMDVERLNQAAMVAIQSPANESGYITELSEYFDTSAGFQVLVISVTIPDMTRRHGVNRAELRIHTALYRWGYQFLLFQLEQRFVLIVNQRDQSQTDAIANHIVEVYARRGWAQESIHIGIGEPVDTVTVLSKSYYAAVSAVRRGAQVGRSVQRFRDMGFYKLLYSIADDALLEEYYHQRLKPLLDYDAEHGGEYVETLFRYLLHDGSLSAVAEEMYTHRNTVNYRMGKIRDMLNLDLTTQSQRFPLLLAFHIGVILGEVKDYELEIQRNAQKQDP